MKNIFGKIVGIVLTIAMLASSMSFAAFADNATTAPFSGSGTEQDPYLISTAADLVTLAELTNMPADHTEYEDKYYKITNDIDMTGVTDFYGIARREKQNGSTYTLDTGKTSFKGTIDGDGHIISNMTIDRSNNTDVNNMAALVCWSGGSATIKNLGLVSPTITASTIAAGFVGRGKAVIENCFIRGTASLTAGTTAAFIGAFDTDSVVRNCYAVKDGLSPASMNGSNTPITLTNVYVKTNVNISNFSTRTNFYAHGGNNRLYVNNTEGYVDGSIDKFVTASNGAFETDTYGKNGSNGFVLAWENDVFSGGSGTEAEPYLISTPEDLVELSELTNLNTDAYNTFDSAYYKLTNDIDMTEINGFLGVSPCRSADGGFSNTGSFKGTIDGNYHTISNMTADSSNSNGFSALVAYAGGCTIKNLGLIDPVLTGTTRAAFACCRLGGATIDNCFVKGLDYISNKDQYAFTAYANINVKITNSYCTDNGIIAYQGNSEKKAVEVSNVFTWNGPIFEHANIYANNLNSVGDNHTVEKTNAFIAASNGAFEEDIFSKNGTSGIYPVLAWENGFYITLDGSNNVILSNRTNAPVTGKLLIAAYKTNEEMLEPVYMKDISLDAWKADGYADVTIEYTPNAAATIHKAFVWNDLTDLTPLCIAARYPAE